jgi:hypothetical protein
VFTELLLGNALTKSVTVCIEASHNQFLTFRSAIPPVSNSGKKAFEYRPGDYLNVELMEMEIK